MSLHLREGSTGLLFLFFFFFSQDKDPWNLFNNAMESLQGLLREILLQDPVPSTLENILKVSRI